MSIPANELALVQSINYGITHGRSYGPWSYAKDGAVVHILADDYDGARPAPAWWNPKTGDAFIDVDKADGDRFKTIDNAVNRKVAGLVSHELAHSRWSDWNPKDLTSDSAVAQVLTLLEEIRIENYAANRSSQVREWLRASLDIILAGAREPVHTMYGAAMRWVLIYGRVYGGIIDPEELGWLDIAVRTALGDEIVDELADIVAETLTISWGQPKKLVPLAERIIELVGEPDPEEGGGGCGHDHTEENDDGGASEASESGDDAESRDGEDSTEGSSGAGGEDADDKDIEDGDGHEDQSGTKTPELAADDAAAVSEAFDKVIAKVDAEWDNQPIRLADPMKTATEVFGRMDEETARRADIVTPKPHHRRLVGEVARHLDRLVLPAVTKRPIAKVVPPGKLRTREALKASVEMSQGRMVTAKPWKGTKRTHQAVKVMRVGILTDTSGSMRWAKDAVALFAYAWANAGHRVGARTAAITFGDHAHAVAKPGSIMNNIVVHPANGGSEDFDHAAAAADFVLNLSVHDHAAKLLLVVSDGELVNHLEPEKALKWIDRWAKAGTKVVWLTPDRRGAKLLRKLDADKRVIVEVVDRANAFEGIQAAAIRALNEIVRSGGA